VTADLDRILSDFMDAWNAGRRPDVGDFLSRVPPGPERAELADQITTWLTWAPTPDYDDATYDEIASEPLVREVVAAVEQPAGLWPALLARLRRRSRMSTADVASAISEPLGIAGREEKAARYLDDMESGRLDPAGVSRRVLEVLARVLGVRDSDLAAAGDLGWSPRAGGALMRADPDVVAEATPHLELLAEAMAAPSQERWDEVDELFRGGR
jgi:hypothetical protein